MQEKVEIVKDDGTKANLDLISEFEIGKDSQVKRYILMTANELDQNGLIKILASQILDGKIIKIESDDDWTAVKNVMRSIISASPGEFKYTNTSDSMSFPVPDDYARVIAVQEVAKQALIKDYESKKPEAPKLESPNNVTLDPNSSIYPSSNTTTPIGSEVVPGIAEVTPVAVPVEEPNKSEGDAPVVPVADNSEAVAKEETPANDNPNDPVVAIATPDIPTSPIPAQVNNNEEVKVESSVSDVDTSNKAREELIKDIEAAVDKYLSNINKQKQNENVGDIKDALAKMQAELNSLNNTLNTQE